MRRAAVSGSTSRAALFGLGEIGRRRYENLAAAGMAGRFPRVVISLDLFREVGPGGMPHRGEDRRAAPADYRKSIGGAGGNADRRRRLLKGLGHDRDLLEAVVFALVREARLGPGLLDDVEDLTKPLAALGVRDAIGLVGLRHPAAADAEDQPAVAQLIDRRRLPGEPQRMAQR